MHNSKHKKTCFVAIGLLLVAAGGFFFVTQFMSCSVGPVIETDLSPDASHKQVEGVSDVIVQKDNVSTDLTMNADEVLHQYTNRDLGISFVYKGAPDDTIIQDGNDLMVSRTGQDVIHVYKKAVDVSFQQAVELLLQERGANMNNCALNEERSGDTRKLYVVYQNDQPSYDKIGFPCTDFEQGSFRNAFFYQESKSKTTFAFVRHLSGLDASPWDVNTIEFLE